MLNLSNGIRLPFAKPLVSLDVGVPDLAGDAGELSVDELCEAIQAPGLVTRSTLLLILRFPPPSNGLSNGSCWLRELLQCQALRFACRLHACFRSGIMSIVSLFTVYLGGLCGMVSG